MLPPLTLNHLLIGQSKPFGPNGEPSAIGKHVTHDRVRLTQSGLVGDTQADRRHHGGPEKALHHYAADHYPSWQTEFPAVTPCHWQPGAFGENISTTGITEAAVCVGDIFRLGGVLLQVSQARQPCWKLNLRFALPDMATQVQSTLRTGWYYRVLESGFISAGQALVLVERLEPDWPLTRLLRYLYQDSLNREALTAIAALAVLTPSWRQLAARRLVSGKVEDWAARLNTPA